MFNCNHPRDASSVEHSDLSNKACNVECPGALNGNSAEFPVEKKGFWLKRGVHFRRTDFCCTRVRTKYLFLSYLIQEVNLDVVLVTECGDVIVDFRHLLHFFASQVKTHTSKSAVDV